MAGIGGQSLARVIGEHQPPQSEEGGCARDRSEIVRVADAIQHQERFASLRPAPGFRRIEIRDGLRLRERQNAAMHGRARDPRQFITLHDAIRPVALGERDAHLTRLALQSLHIVEPVDALGRRPEQGRDRGPAGDALQLLLLARGGCAAALGAGTGHWSLQSLTQVSSCLLWWRCMSRDPGIAAKACCVTKSVCPWNLIVHRKRLTVPASSQRVTSRSSRSG